jgi:hypothetical protein
LLLVVEVEAVPIVKKLAVLAAVAESLLQPVSL